MEAKRRSRNSGKGWDLLSIKLLLLGALVITASIAGCKAAITDFPESMGGARETSGASSNSVPGETGGVDESSGGEPDDVRGDHDDAGDDSPTPPASSWLYAYKHITYL